MRGSCELCDASCNGPRPLISRPRQRFLAGLQIFLYNGVNANKYEKAKGCEMVQKINNERGARATVTVLEDDPHNATFWGALGGEIEVTDEGEDDEAAAAAAAAQTRL